MNKEDLQFLLVSTLLILLGGVFIYLITDMIAYFSPLRFVIIVGMMLIAAYILERLLIRK